MNRSHRARGACAAITLVAFSGCASTLPAKDPAQAASQNQDQNPAIAPADPALSNPPHLALASDTSIPRAFGWVSVAIGAQAAVVAITTSFLMLHQSSVRSGDCNAQKICSEPGLDANSKLDAFAPWNAGAWALAAVGVGVGAYLILSNPPETQKTTAIGVGPDGSGVGLNLRSRF